MNKFMNKCMKCMNKWIILRQQCIINSLIQGPFLTKGPREDGVEVAEDHDHLRTILVVIEVLVIVVIDDLFVVIEDLEIAVEMDVEVGIRR